MSEMTDPQLSLGQIQELIKSGKLQEAQAALKQFLKLNPNNADAWYMVSLTTNNVERQTQVLERALKINPQHSPSLKRLASLQGSTQESNSFPDQITPSQPIQPESPAKSPNRLPFILGGAVAIILVAAIIGLFLLSNSNKLLSPEDTAQKFEWAASNNDTNTIKSLLTDQFRSELVLFCGDNLKCSGSNQKPIQTITVLSSSTNGDTAQVVLKTTYTAAEPASCALLDLLKTDIWRIGKVTTQTCSVQAAAGNTSPPATLTASAIPTLNATNGTPAATPSLVPVSGLNPFTAEAQTSAANATTYFGNIYATRTMEANQNATLFPQMTHTYAAELAAWNTQTATIQFAATQTKVALTQTFTALAVNLQGQIAFVQNGDLYVMNADGSKVHPLTQNSFGVKNPAFSPDGKVIAFEYKLAIYLINADGSNIRNLTKDKSEREAAFPAWSPDGKQMVFRLYAMNTNYYLAVINLDGSNIHHLTDGKGLPFSPAWSPDGKQIAFQKDNQVVVMNADGSNPKQITAVKDVGVFSPVWSPDGKQLMVEGHANGNAGLYLMNNDGSGFRMISDPKMSSSAPSWSPDGKTIVFSGSVGFKSAMYAMSVSNLSPVALPSVSFDANSGFSWTK
jgi:Tol biopolymer transport system component